MRVSELDFEVQALATIPILRVNQTVILLDLFSNKNCPLGTRLRYNLCILSQIFRACQS